MAQPLIEELREYFQLSANGWLHRKTLQEIQHIFQVNTRLIRRTIRELKNNGFLIVSDVRTKRNGYFLMDEHSAYDHVVLSIYIKHSKAKILNSWGAISCYNKIFPVGQLKLGYK